jgi:hypothetical protein
MVQAFPDEPDRIVVVRPLPGDALIELAVRHRLGRRFVLAQGDSLHLSKRRRVGGHQGWRRCWLNHEASVVSMQSECPQ